MQQVCAALGVPLEMLEVPPMAASVLQRMCVNLLKVMPATTLRDGVYEYCFLLAAKWPTLVVLGCSG